jgi:hypothetical protein
MYEENFVLFFINVGQINGMERREGRARSGLGRWKKLRKKGPW